MKISPIATSAGLVGNVEGTTYSPRSLTVTTNKNSGLSAVPEPAGVPAQSEVQIKSEKEEALEVTKPLSPQYAALAKQRRALQQEREAFEKDKASAQVNRVELTKIKSDPLSVLAEAGVTYDDLTNAILASQGNSEVAKMKAEIKALKEGVDKQFTERDVQAEQQVLAQMKREAEELARDDTYELVRETRSIPDVMKLIERTYRETGEVLDVGEAMSLVEEELTKEAYKLATLKKVQSKLAPPSAPIPQQRTLGMRTLTNRDTASPTGMSAKQRALAAFAGTLKK